MYFALPKYFTYRHYFSFNGIPFVMSLLLSHCDSGIEGNVILFEYLEKTKKIDFHVQNSTVFAHCSSDFYLIIFN